MKIILIDNINKLGNFGDNIQVCNGYARNFLLPQGTAVSATKKNIAIFETYQIAKRKKLTQQSLSAKQRSKSIDALKEIIIIAKSSNEGKLFGSIGTRDIANAVTKKGIRVSKSEIHLPKGVLRTTGIFKVDIHLSATINKTITVKITSSHTD